MIHYSRRGFLWGTAAFGAVVSTADQTAWSAQDSVLRIRNPKDIQNLDPAFNVNVSDFNIKTAILVKLITYNGSGKWEWELDAARSIEQVDATHIKFALRPGIRWTKGFGEVTTEDVKYSFERIADPKTKSPYRADWELLDRVDIIDAYTGVIVLKKPSATVWRTSLPMTAGDIVCKKAVEGVGGTFTTEPPATCGPYIIKEWVARQKTVLARNPDWTGPRPDFDEIHVLPIDDDKVAELAFEAHELDFTSIAVSSLKSWRAKPPPGSRLDVKDKPGLEWLGMNTAKAPFDDLRVRQAVRKAIDVDMVLDAAYFGAAERATGLIPKSLPGYRDTPYPKRDVDGAKKLLAEAGHAGGFKATLSVLNASETTTMAQVVQANLGEIGIDVQINALESGLFWALGDESKGTMWKDLQMFIHRWANGPDPDFASRWYTCDQIGKWNWERWCNVEYSELNTQGLSTIDEAKRAQIYRRMADLLDESAAYVLFTHGINAVAYLDSIVPATMPDGTRFILPKFRRA